MLLHLTGGLIGSRIGDIKPPAMLVVSKNFF
jgi:hypothetical protein